jgi:hypothetical protein
MKPKVVLSKFPSDFVQVLVNSRVANPGGREKVLSRISLEGWFSGGWGLRGGAFTWRASSVAGEVACRQGERVF